MFCVEVDHAWNPEVLKDFPGKFSKIVFLLNTAQTIVKLNDEPFPFKDESKYVFSQNKIDTTLWKTAISLEFSNSLIESCGLFGIKPGKIHAIDTLEYRMCDHLSTIYRNELICLFFMQPPGIKLIFLQDGLPQSCYFFSNDPNFRILELTRIWLSQLNAPKTALLMSDCAWLQVFLSDRQVKVIDGFGLKQDMIKKLIS